VLYALRSTDSDDGRLRELVSAPLVDDSLHAEALELLRASRALAEARRTLQGYADASRAMLAELPPQPARDALEALTDVVVARTS
jgi:heptaprenyl diphosphate synthase